MSQTQTGEKELLKISVRNLVEFLLKEGDIDNRYGRLLSSAAMQEGSRIHRKIQKRMGPHYQAEVPLGIVIEEETYRLAVEGRADGILTAADGSVTVDEIKGVYRNVAAMEAPAGVHRAQAMCYAYIYALQHGLERIDVQLTYCNLDTEELRYFRESFLFPDLAAWFEALTGEYRRWALFQSGWRKLHRASIQKLEFPFEYRKGQKDLAAGVYRTISRKKTLFIQAPTGAGKTLSVIFPAVKAVGEGLGDKIFYLTAKTITSAVALETFQLLKKQGYRAKIVQITAKEKLCCCDVMDCNPVHCPRAGGHFERVNDAVYDLLQKEDVLTREVFAGQSVEYRVCPFELCLDTASWADVVICDYNYVFDPNVYLKRFFAEGSRGDYLFLVDEAHNLVDRGREMYSESICKEDFPALKKMIKDYSLKSVSCIDKCNRILLGYKRECEKYEVYPDIGNLAYALGNLAEELEEFLENTPEFPERRAVTDFYFRLRNFRNIYELVDERYVIYTEHGEDGRFRLRLYCVDPSANLQERTDKGRAAIFFSATLLPVHYYKTLLSTRTDNYAVYAQTAFSAEQRLLLLARDVSSRYTRRNRAEYGRMAEYILRTAQSRKGNYMIFFPSYQMMEQVHCVFLENGRGEMPETLVQKPGMSEEEREHFLQAFSAEPSAARGTSLVAFCVLGGIFGEGIDLKKEQLIGALIVGTGLPQISSEREILMEYYDRRCGEGFDFAYRYPGMNKVLQAAGRVIRTAEDAGVIILLDERFLQGDYRRLFPREWEKREVCSVATLSGCLEAFWRQRDGDAAAGKE